MLLYARSARLRKPGSTNQAAVAAAEAHTLRTCTRPAPTSAIGDTLSQARHKLRAARTVDQQDRRKREAGGETSNDDGAQRAQQQAPAPASIRRSPQLPSYTRGIHSQPSDGPFNRSDAEVYILLM